MANATYYEGCDCAIFENCTNSTIVTPPTPPIVPIPPVPPSGSTCNYTCQDILALHVALANLTDVVTAQQNDIDMIMGQLQTVTAQISALQASQNATDASVTTIDNDIADLYTIQNGMCASCQNTTLTYIQNNGLNFGQEWWFGSQGSYLFAIDYIANSYYRFSPGTNTTL